MQTIQVGNAPCSWGIIGIHGTEGEHAGYAHMLDELAATGYAGTELGDWGFMPTDPAVLRAELDGRGLNMLGAYVGVDFKNPAAHAAGEALALKVARLLAAVTSGREASSLPRGSARDEESRAGGQSHKPFINLADDNASDPVRSQNAGRITPEMSLTGREWEVFARGVDHIARRVTAETGLPVLFHPHCAGYIETPAEIARLLQMVAPDVLGIVFDTGHYAYGSGSVDGSAVLEGVDRFADRIQFIHLKDCEPRVAAAARSGGMEYNAAVGRGLFCELGKGCVDFPSVLARLRARDYSGWVLVEQDVLPGMGTPKDSARRNRDYLRTIGL
jgi:inosose dehydratase